MGAGGCREPHAVQEGKEAMSVCRAAGALRRFMRRMCVVGRAKQEHSVLGRRGHSSLRSPHLGNLTTAHVLWSSQQSEVNFKSVRLRTLAPGYQSFQITGIGLLPSVLRRKRSRTKRTKRASVLSLLQNSGI